VRAFVCAWGGACCVCVCVCVWVRCGCGVCTWVCGVCACVRVFKNAQSAHVSKLTLQSIGNLTDTFKLTDFFFHYIKSPFPN